MERLPLMMKMTESPFRIGFSNHANERIAERGIGNGIRDAIIEAVERGGGTRKAPSWTKGGGSRSDDARWYRFVDDDGKRCVALVGRGKDGSYSVITFMKQQNGEKLRGTKSDSKVRRKFSRRGKT